MLFPVFAQLLEGVQALGKAILALGKRDRPERPPEIFAQFGRVIVGAGVRQLLERGVALDGF